MSASTSEEQPGQTTIAKHPFNALATADIIIRSSDLVDFHVHKATLSIASPFFEDMFSLRQPPSVSDQGTFFNQSRDVVPVTETSETLDSLFRFIYPVFDPDIQDLNKLEDVLKAALKYQVTVTSSVLRTKLQAFINMHPLKVYIIACRLDIGEEAQQAAKVWKAKRSWNEQSKVFSSTLAGATYVHEMSNISAGAYFRLLKFLHSPDNAELLQFSPPSSSPSSAQANSGGVMSSIFLFNIFTPPDIILRSRDGIDLQAHRQLLLMVSGEGKFLANVDPNGDAAYSVDLDIRTLRELIRLCYPFQTIPSTPGYFRDLPDVIDAALSYELTGIVDLLSEHCAEHAHVAPLDIYVLAVRHGWQKAAERAARHVHRQDLLSLYIPSMESISAQAYYELLKFRHEHMSCITNQFNQLLNIGGQWHGVRDADGEALSSPPLVPLPVIESFLVGERGNSTTACYNCRTQHNPRTNCNCMEDSLKRLSERGERIQKEIDDAQAQIKLDLPWKTSRLHQKLKNAILTAHQENIGRLSSGSE